MYNNNEQNCWRKWNSCIFVHRYFCCWAVLWTCLFQCLKDMGLVPLNVANQQNIPTRSCSENISWKKSSIMKKRWCIHVPWVTHHQQEVEHHGVWKDDGQPWTWTAKVRCICLSIAKISLTHSLYATFSYFLIYSLREEVQCAGWHRERAIQSRRAIIWR